jgi:hypothetical protein
LRRPSARLVTVTFVLAADEPGASFRCRLDQRAFRPCPKRVHLKAGVGRHRFDAYAVDALGNEGTEVARRLFRVQRQQAGRLF